MTAKLPPMIKPFDDLRRLFTEFQMREYAWLAVAAERERNGWKDSPDGMSKVRIAPDAAAPAVPTPSKTFKFKY